MKHVIVINIDHQNNDRTVCARVWSEIEQRMRKAGFAKHKRLFVSTLGWDATCEQAQAVVAETEKVLADENIVIFNLIKEFYCFEFNRMNDLLDPCHHAPDVSFIDSETFKAFLDDSNTG